MITTDSKKIIKYLLDQVLSRGNLYEDFHVNYDALSEQLDLKNENYCHVCFQYLAEHNYIFVIDGDYSGSSVRLTAYGIDFLESN